MYAEGDGVGGVGPARSSAGPLALVTEDAVVVATLLGLSIDLDSGRLPALQATIQRYL